MGLGLSMYVQDYDETYPPSAVNVQGTSLPANPAWPLLIYPYVKNLAVFACPSQLDVDTVKNGLGKPENYKAAGPRNYSANDQVLAWVNGTPKDGFGCPINRKIRTLAEIPEPANIIAILEVARSGTVLVQQNPFVPTHHWWSVENESSAYLAWKNPNASERNQAAFDYVALLRHLGGGNYTFADGHAKWMKPEMTLRRRQATSPSGNMWQWDKDTFKEFM
jgi:prepilin-type processing-associated H-X9-DG protein